jgi:hypothetical protein
LPRSIPHVSIWSLFFAWIFAEKISTVKKKEKKEKKEDIYGGKRVKACYVACSKHVFSHIKCFMLEEAAGTVSQPAFWSFEIF